MTTPQADVNAPLDLLPTCHRCRLPLLDEDERNEVTLKCEDGRSAKGVWCDECWPLVVAGILTSIGGAVGSC